MRRRPPPPLLALSLLALLVVAGCADAEVSSSRADGDTPDEAPAAAPSPDASHDDPDGGGDPAGEADRAPRDGSAPAEADGNGGEAPDDPDAGDGAAAGPTVAVVDDRLVLDEGGDRSTLTRLDAERDGEVVHASVRPGEHPTTTVLLLTRRDGRYELRYLVADESGVSDVYGLPWRLQMDPDLARIADVAPTPVWSPDGDAVAWLEWDERGTRLRTLGWRDHAGGSNPSEDAQTYRVDDVPVGTQLERWETAGRLPTLHGSDGERRWRIELDLERRAVALPA